MLTKHWKNELKLHSTINNTMTRLKCLIKAVFFNPVSAEPRGSASFSASFYWVPWKSYQLLYRIFKMIRFCRMIMNVLRVPRVEKGWKAVDFEKGPCKLFTAQFIWNCRSKIWTTKFSNILFELSNPQTCVISDHVWVEFCNCHSNFQMIPITISSLKNSGGWYER